MSAPLQFSIPIDEFLDQVFTALISADVDNLQQLEAQAPFVVPPRSEARFALNRAIFAALLEMAPRDLRLLRRAPAETSPEIYHPQLRLDKESPSLNELQ